MKDPHVSPQNLSKIALISFAFLLALLFASPVTMLSQPHTSQQDTAAAVEDGDGRPEGFIGGQGMDPTRAPAEKEWTVLVYMDADNNLESEAIKDFNEMEAIGSTDQVNIVVQMDRINGYDATNGDWTGCKRFYVQHDILPIVMNSKEVQDLGEADMGDGETLNDFIWWGVLNYPANHYALILWDHGSGMDGVCYDDTNGSYLDIWEITFKNSFKTVNTKEYKIDIIGFDACMMQQVEVVYALKGLCDYVVASQDLEMGTGWPYDKMLVKLTEKPTMEPKKFSTICVEEFGKYYQTLPFQYSLSAIDVDKFWYDFIPKFNALSERMIFGVQLYRISIYNPISVARGSTWTIQSKYMDIYDFCMNLESQTFIPGTVGDDILSYSQETRFYLNQSIIAHVQDSSSPPYGLSVFFPLDKTMLGSLDNWFYNELQWDGFLNIYFTPGLASINPNQGPRVAITYPEEYDFINGTITINGTFFVNTQGAPLSGASIGVELCMDRGGLSPIFDPDLIETSPNNYMWSYELDTTRWYSNGPHIITACGYQDLKGVTVFGDAWDHVLVHIDNGEGNDPPKIEITNPVSDQQIVNKTSYLVSGWASDSDQGVSKVEVSVPSVNDDWVQASGTTAWTYIWDISALYGWQTIRARAYDGMTYTYDSVDVYIINPAISSPPVAVISSPLEGAIYETTDTIYFDGSKSSDPDSDPLQYSWDSNISGDLSSEVTFSTQLQPGHHQIMLSVFDGYYPTEASINITVTDVPTETFLVIDFDTGTWREVEAYLRETRDNCYVYVEVGYEVDSTDWADTFNETIFPTMHSEMGYAPDMDSEGHVWMLACHLGGNIAGYYVDNDPNGHDMIYIDADYGDISVVSHEFGHMTHHNYDAGEERWIDEGIAQYCPWFIGLGSAETVTHLPYFLANPDTPAVWREYTGDLMEDLARYGVAFAMQEYLADHFGGSDCIGEELRDGESFDPDVAQNYHGMKGVEHMLELNGYNETFFDVFRGFTVANFIDAPEFSNGQFGYSNIDVHAARTDTIDTFPAEGSETLDPYAADCYDIQGGTGKLTVNVTCKGSNSTFIVTHVGYELNSDNELEPMSMGQSTWYGDGEHSDEISDFGTGTDLVTLIIANYGEEGATYDYAVSLIDEHNLPPIAVAGEDVTVYVRDTVSLDGTGSYDPDGTIARYLWDFDATNGVDWEMPDSQDSTPAYRYDNPGTYTVTLRVIDYKGAYGEDSLTVKVLPPNRPPVAEAGIDQEVRVLDIVNFDASISSDPDGDALTYSWNFTDGNMSSDAKTSHAFERPDSYEVALTVTDPLGAKDTDTVRVSVMPNKAPYADAGEDIKVKLGDIAQFNASSTIDPESDPMTYTWDFDDADGVTAQAKGVSATYLYPKTGTYTVTMTVTDKKDAVAWDTLTVFVNAPPEAKAGPDLIVRANEAVPFDGTGSIDPQGKPLMYYWDMNGDGKTDQTEPAFTYKFKNVGEYVINLTVKNQAGYTSTDQCIITVLSPKILYTPVFISPLNGDIVKGTVTLRGSIQGWEDVDGMYYRANGGSWSTIPSYDGGAWSFNVNTKDFDDGALVIEVKAVMGDDETEPNDCYLALEVDNIVPTPEPPATDDDDVTEDEPNETSNDDKILGFEPYDLLKFGLFLLLIIVISIIILVIIARLRGPRSEDRPYFTEPLEEEPDMELEEEEIFADVTMAPEETPAEKTSAPTPGDTKTQTPPRSKAPEVKTPKTAKKKAAPDQGHLDWDDTDFVDDWKGPEMSMPPGLELKKEPRTVAPVICPSCKKTFDIIDDGKRPLRTKCAHCGKEGVIKGNKVEADTKGGIGIRCPSCKALFQVPPDDKEAVCPSCGAVGTVPT